MTSTARPMAMSEDAYFEMLEKSVDKYEYFDGVAVAMAGAQPDHVTVEGNIFGELFQKLRGKNCRPNVSDLAVKLAGDRGYLFPDVTVVCGKPEHVVRRGIGCLLNPTVVVEVQSPRTARIDETHKLLAYSAMRSVREYLLVSSEFCAVKLFSRRTPDETWSFRLFAAPTDRVDLESCGCSLTLAEIYAGVDLAGKDLLAETPPARDREIRAQLDIHWAASDASDLETEHRIYHEDAVLEYPQSGERTRGRANIRNQRASQPDKKRFAVRRIIGGGDLWVTEFILTYDGKPSYTVSIMEFRGEKVARETQYFADPFVAPAWRAQWVERMDAAAD